MNRQYLAPHRVAVYANQEAKDAGKPVTTADLVPYPHSGFDNYKYGDVMYPGYVDPHGCDSCIILTNPLFKNIRGD